MVHDDNRLNSLNTEWSRGSCICARPKTTKLNLRLLNQAWHIIIHSITFMWSAHIYISQARSNRFWCFTFRAHLFDCAVTWHSTTQCMMHDLQIQPYTHIHIHDATDNLLSHYLRCAAAAVLHIILGGARAVLGKRHSGVMRFDKWCTHKYHTWEKKNIILWRARTLCHIVSSCVRDADSIFYSLLQSHTHGQHHYIHHIAA